MKEDKNKTAEQMEELMKNYNDTKYDLYENDDLYEFCDEDCELIDLEEYNDEYYKE